ncbi:kinase-like domain-containing protein [Rhizophagus irregularis DAOM 181602=DAOM 197198]|nr:kinase-like domain-containing protein [Rhizophagus irregularis DAOM 181602=DAOM 197198]
MASRDTKKKRKLEEEHLKYSNLLDRYKARHIVKNAGRISKSRKCVNICCDNFAFEDVEHVPVPAWAWQLAS